MILRRLPDSRYSEVLREWEGETVVLIGGGPSLTFDDIERVSLEHGAGRLKCIAINSAYLLAGFADVLYAADSHWHKWHREGVSCERLGLSAERVRQAFSGFAGQKCSIQNSGANITDDLVHILRNKTYPAHGEGLSLDQCALVTGRNSGFQALNLAILAGAKTVLLLGFDGREVEGRSHFLGSHPRPTPLEAYPNYRKAMNEAEQPVREAGVTVLNCSPGSVINTWPKVPLEVALIPPDCRMDGAFRMRL